jgi:hypothetical protein
VHPPASPRIFSAGRCAISCPSPAGAKSFDKKSDGSLSDKEINRVGKTKKKK